MVQADINGDGRLDLISGNYGSTEPGLNGYDAGIAVSLANPSGGFRAALFTPTAAPVRGLAVASVDGGPAIMAFSNNSVLLLRSGDGGALTPSSNLTLDGGRGDVPGDVLVGDINGDGFDDIVAFNFNSLTAVWLQSSQGSFTYVPGPFVEPQCVAGALADFDLDGRLDLALTVQESVSHPWIGILRGIDGGFTTPSYLVSDAGFAPSAIVAGDFIPGGGLELVVTNTANNQGQTVSLYGRTADGGFGVRSHYTVGFLPWSLASADMDKDGRLDLLIGSLGAAPDAGHIDYLAGLADGGFMPLVQYPVFDPRLVEVFDLNGDGQLDIITGNVKSSNLTLHLSSGPNCPVLSPASGW